MKDLLLLFCFPCFCKSLAKKNKLQKQQKILDLKGRLKDNMAAPDNEKEGSFFDLPSEFSTDFQDPSDDPWKTNEPNNSWSFDPTKPAEESEILPVLPIPIEPNYTQPEMSTDCIKSTTDSFFTGFSAGSFFGFMTGMYSYKKISTTTPKFLFLSKTIASQAMTFGLFYGAYRGTLCSMYKLRGTHDLLNIGIAGGVASLTSFLTSFPYLYAIVPRHQIPKLAVSSIILGTSVLLAAELVSGMFASSAGIKRGSYEPHPERPLIIKNNDKGQWV